MSDLPLYLIAHKVRGQPAFDIATCEEVEGEEHWIIPTSGHRAYPYWNTQLDSALAFEGVIQDVTNNIPPNWPDHYTVRRSPSTPAPAGRDILKDLGLLPKAQPIRRL